jgi:DNA-binding transcriptional ArsR family regulator
MHEHIEAVDLDEIDRRTFHVAITPLPSLLVSLLDALDDPVHRSAPWRQDIRGHLRTRDYAALLPLRGQGWHPDFAFPPAAAPIATIDDELERIAATPPEQIEAEVEGLRACPGKDRWRLASRGGSRWRDNYLDALARAWRGYRPVWERARPALEGEVRRIGASVALGATVEVLVSVNSRSRVADNQWQLSSNISRRLHLSDHPLRLVPIVHPTRRVLLTDDDRGGLREVGYSLRDVEGPLSGLAPAPEALESLLGAPRATCLRRLDRPVTAGALAEALAAVPSAATHHINALERAGLVRRERSGRRVLVWRTRRGTALLELYS